MSRKNEKPIEYTGDWVLCNYPPSPMTYAYAVPVIHKRPGYDYGDPVYLHEMSQEEAFAFVMAAQATNRLRTLLKARQAAPRSRRA